MGGIGIANLTSVGEKLKFGTGSLIDASAPDVVAFRSQADGSLMRIKVAPASNDDEAVSYGALRKAISDLPLIAISGSLATPPTGTTPTLSGGYAQGENYIAISNNTIWACTGPDDGDWVQGSVSIGTRIKMLTTAGSFLANTVYSWNGTTWISIGDGLTPPNTMLVEYTEFVSADMGISLDLLTANQRARVVTAIEITAVNQCSYITLTENRVKSGGSVILQGNRTTDVSPVSVDYIFTTDTIGVPWVCQAIGAQIPGGSDTLSLEIVGTGIALSGKVRILYYYL